MRNQQVADHKSILSVFHHCGMVAATGCLLFIANISVFNADELYENNTTLSYSYSPVYSILMPFMILILDSPLRQKRTTVYCENALKIWEKQH